MNLSSLPSDHLASLVQQLGKQLQGLGTKSSDGLEPALATARELEQRSLEGGLPLLAGAAICLQHRVPALFAGPAVRKEFKLLAQAWLKHGPQLLGSAGDPALEQAWIALQPHLAITLEEGGTQLGDVMPAPVGTEEPVDAGAFLDSLDATAEPPVPEVTMVAEPAAAPTTPAPEPEPAQPAPQPALAATPAQLPPPPAPAPVEEEPVPQEILEAFAQESREAFEAMEQSIMAWETNGCRVDDLRNVFRLAHSVKGAANSVGLRAVGSVLHRLEDLLEDLVEGRGCVAAHALPALVLSLIDALRSALAGGQSASPAWKDTADQLIGRIADLRATMVAVPVAEEPAATPVENASVVPAEVPEPVAGIVEPAPAVAESAALVPAKAAPVSVTGEARPEHSTIRVEISHLDKLMNLVGDLLINRHRLNRKLQQVTSLRGELMRARERLLHVVGDFNEHHEFSQRRQAATHAPSDGFSELEMDRYDDFNILSRSLVEIASDAEEVITQIDGHFGTFSEEAVQFTNVTRQLQEDVARTRMVPLDQLFRRLQRAVRDACSSEGKVVNFVVEGAENRIDKFISDQLFRPLLHIVRNAVAHGIEPAADRLAAGKPAEGRLLVRSRTEAGRLALELSDDGGGLHRDDIIRVARTRGLLAATIVPDDAQLAELIFQPGFSTAATTTDVSGRGVGLDVARQELTNLGGTVSVISRPGQGCTFVLTLPVTLAINQVMFVECGKQVFALPINFVERVVPAQAAAFAMSGQSEMLMLDKQQTVPVVRLHTRLGLPDDRQAVTAVILTLADRRTALIVDRIQSKVDIVVKPLGPLLNRHPFFSGATLAGDGRVIFILDVPRLLASGATRTRGAAVPTAPRLAAEDADAPAGGRRILVVDDSLSIRRIAANYLSRAGLEVDTAVDGSDALEKLRAGGFSLVVSDLEMPRVNGFELIAEMRRHPDMANIPVIILTSRDAAKHRDRARELGAAGYLIKPVSREQLTEAVTALLEQAGLEA